MKEGFKKKERSKEKKKRQFLITQNTQNKCTSVIGS